MARDTDTTQLNPAGRHPPDTPASSGAGQQSRATAINLVSGHRDFSAGDATQINPEAADLGRGEAAGGDGGDRRTAVNPALGGGAADIPMGTKLLHKYEVERVLSSGTGEAVLYVCRYEGQAYVAKVYRRSAAIKPEVVVVLQEIESPYVAKLYASGIWNGLPFEIIPYYDRGSLQGRRFPYEELRTMVIPALNEGLAALHRAGIIHKDFKPSNIMLCDDKETTAIIDFGISSMRQDGRTIVVTRTGMTPDYSAPETFHNLFLEESDYYSLGITVYELFCGHTPYQGVDSESLERYISVQRLPFPEGFPERLKQLVLGLTYTDITNRKDKRNPNRRWTYDEVADGAVEKTSLSRAQRQPPHRRKLERSLPRAPRRAGGCGGAEGTVHQDSFRRVHECPALRSVSSAGGLGT